MQMSPASLLSGDLLRPTRRALSVAGDEHMNRSASSRTITSRCENFDPAASRSTLLHVYLTLSPWVTMLSDERWLVSFLVEVDLDFVGPSQNPVSLNQRVGDSIPPQSPLCTLSAFGEDLRETLARLDYQLDKAAVRRTVDLYMARISHGSTVSRPCVPGYWLEQTGRRHGRCSTKPSTATLPTSNAAQPGRGSISARWRARST